MSWSPFRARRERTLRRLASAMLALPDGKHFVWPMIRDAGISSGTIYPTLARLEVDGWVVSGWQDPAPEGRPRRRWYQLTELGRRELAALLRTEAS